MSDDGKDVKVALRVTTHQTSTNGIIVVLTYTPLSLSAKDQAIPIEMPWEQAIEDFPMGAVFDVVRRVPKP